MKPRKISALSALAGVVLAVATSNVFAEQDFDDRHERHESYAIGLWGDLPYSDLQAQVGVPNLIADMNRQDLAFTIHDGDLKAGNGTPGSATPTTCSDALYLQALSFFNALRAPAMLTSGDNDWTDCDRRPTAGSPRSSGSITSARCSSTRHIPWAIDGCARKCRRR